jgi:DNA-binding transcriptional regulator YiaG
LACKIRLKWGFMVLRCEFRAAQDTGQKCWKNLRGDKLHIAMTAEELKTKRLALGFRSRSALAKALGVTKYAVEHWEYERRAIPGWVPRFLL